jgi:hypothetical protein
MQRATPEIVSASGVTLVRSRPAMDRLAIRRASSWYVRFARSAWEVRVTGVARLHRGRR